MKVLFVFAAVIATFYGSAAFGEARAHVFTEGRAFLGRQPDNVDKYEGRLQAEYDNTFAFSENFSFKLHPFFQVSTLPEAWGTPFIADPKELHLAMDVDGIYAQLGYFTLVYEGTDGINPMDIASMKYWGDPLRPITKASAGIHIGYASNMFEVQAAYIPEQSPSTFPGESSAWLPRKTEFPIQSEDSELRLPDRVDYKYLNREVLDHALRHNYTARAQLRTDFGDAAVAFFEGAADTPMVFIPIVNGTLISASPKLIVLLDSPISVTPRYYRRQTVAGLITKPIGEWIFRVASRYDQPMGSGKQFTTYSGQSVAGVERSFTMSDTLLTVVLQGSLVQAPESNGLVSMRDLFDKSVMLGFRWAASDALTLQLSGLQSTKDGSGFYSGGLDYTFAEAWTAKASVEVVEGPPRAVLGIFTDNDRASLGVVRAF
jgi:hypothetical protein